MGVYLNIVDHDHDFYRISGVSPTIINDQRAFTEKDIEELNKLIRTVYSGDLLTNIPTCKCGELVGEYNYDPDPELAPVCPNCNTTVRLHTEENLNAVTWIRAPIGVKGLMNPLIWSMLSNRFKVGHFNTINWICDPYYRIPSGLNPPSIINALESRGVKRGFNNFIDNFDEYIDILTQLKKESTLSYAGKSKHNFLLELIKQNRNKIFPKYLPVPHNSLLVVEENNTGFYVDAFTPMAINAIQSLAGIDIEEPGKNPTTLRLRESRTVTAIAGLAEYYSKTTSERIARKEGIIRKQCIATRSHWSFRAVVSSITNAHNYRQIEIPWGIGVTVFRLHIVNKLFKLGFTPNEAIAFINHHATKFHPLLNKIFKELIAESSHPLGVNCTINRNPSLHRGSIQSVFIKRVRGELPGEMDMPTVCISILIIRSMNCDFDGDALHFTLTLDNEMQNAIEYLAPHMSAYTLKSPRTISNVMEIPNPVTGMIAEWLDYDEFTPDPIKLEKMQSLTV